MKQLFLIAFLLGATISRGFAQVAATDTTKYNFTIADCVNYAYQHQHDVVNANLDVTSAAYHVKEVIGQGYPQISGTANFLDYLIIPTTLIPGSFIGQPGNVKLKFGVTYQSTLGLAFNQIIFDPNYLVGLAARKTYQQLYDRSYTRNKIDANVNVTKAYYQVLVSVEEIKLLDADIAQLKAQTDETVARNKQGFVEKIDVDRITVQYNTLITNRENTLRLLGVSWMRAL
jgi:outer membrane protein